MYLLLSGTPPFSGRSESEIEDRVLQGRYYTTASVWNTVSVEGKQFLRKLLEYNPEKRISAAQALEEPWFSTVLGQPTDRDPKYAQDVLQNLVSFQTKKRFQDAVWVFMVQHFVAEEDKKRLTQVFEELDTNRDGFLSKDEIIQGCRKYGIKKITSEEITEIMNRIDRNMNGNIDYSGTIFM